MKYKFKELGELLSHHNLSLWISLLYFIITFFLSSFLEVPIQNDSFGYLNYAENLADGKGYDNPYQPPGFSLLISIFIKYFHIDGFFAGKMISIIFSTIFIYITYLIVQKIFNDDKIAIYSQLLVASNFIVVSFSIEPMSDMMFVTLFYISLYLILKDFNNPSYPSFLFAGIFGGLAYLTRTTGLILLITIPILVIFLFNIRIKNRIVLAFIYIICFLGVASPWLIINYLKSGSPFHNELYYNVAYEMYGGGNYNLFYERGDLYNSLTEVILSNPKLFIMHWIKVSLVGIYFIVRRVLNPLVGLLFILSSSVIIFNLRRHANRKLVFISSILFIYYLMMAMSHIDNRFMIPIIPLATAISVYGLLIQWQHNKYKIFGNLLSDKKIFIYKVKKIILISIIFSSIILSGLSISKLLKNQPLEYKEVGTFIRQHGNSSDIVMGYETYGYYTNMRSAGFLPTSLSNISNIDYLIYDERFSSNRGPQFAYLLDPSNIAIPSNFKLIYYRNEFPKVAVYRIINETGVNQSLLQ